MERCAKALHLRTGDRSTDNAIAQWLERHHVECSSCRDPFEACIHALIKPEARPDLILIGTDWLAPDENSVIGRLRETWPAVPLVLYGHHDAAPSAFEPDRGQRRIEGAAALRGFLAEDPSAVVAQLQAAPREQRWDGPIGLAESKLPPTSAPTLPDEWVTRSASISKSASTEVLGAELFASIPVEPATAPRRDASVASHAILTPEELTALLEDDEK